uniref:Indoleamine 2,3-dioxygenase 2 n=1 Tax=Sphenodon punctatus TaxID=8508 RepID=A0A8D0HSF3_SPHPU
MHCWESGWHWPCSTRYRDLLHRNLCIAELPDYYSPWMRLAADLPHLVEGGQLRQEVEKMPLLSIQQLQGHRQLCLAHAALGFITMGYAWQGAGRQMSLPRALAVPFCAISELLGMPPILVYADCVLANWKKREPLGCVENLDVLFSFPGGESNKGFFLVSLLVELAAASGIKAIPTIFNAMLHHDLSTLQTALQDVAASLRKMRDVFTLVHSHVNPGIFFRSLRIYLAGWKDNPLMPEGLVYEGVWDHPRQYAGGSAAQSSTIQCFDMLLGIHHDPVDGIPEEYLICMRDYMPAAHRAFIQAVASGPSLRQFVLAAGDTDLTAAFNKCVSSLVALRSYHIEVVVKYITIPAGQYQEEQKQRGGCFHQDLLGLCERGTGGTGFIQFLKAIRDNTQKAHLAD